VGHFPGYRWAEWNGRFRDDLRKFVKGEPGLMQSVAARLTGSPDLYKATGHLPVNSVNFINAHDGFTLNDLVSYNGKHNDANGEENRDGVDDNDSWNCGVEGPTNDETVEALRDQQVKNFATLLLVSQGVPMFVMGDEVRRTQGGNNNAYCHDNEISWFDWNLTEENQEVFRFWKYMIRFRLDHPTLHRSRFFIGAVNERGLQDITWHGTELGAPGWEDPEARALGFTLAGFDGEPDIHVMANMYWEPLEMAVPSVEGRSWARVVDTSEPSPDDIKEPGSEVPFSADAYSVGGRSIVILISK
jgi:glycogen operon protein